MLNSHASSGEKCVEIVKTLHVKFFPFGSVEPVGSVTVKRKRESLLHISSPTSVTNIKINVYGIPKPK